MRLLCTFSAAMAAGVSLCLVFWAWQGQLSVPVAVIINMVVVLVLYFILRTKAHYSIGLPFLTAALWPGLGPVWLAGTCLFKKWEVHDSEQLESYQRYIQAMQVLSEAKVLGRINVMRDVNVISGFAELLHSAPQRKKEFVLQSAELPQREQVALLRKALYDEDEDVRHYAAATLAKLDQQYEEAFSALLPQADRDPEVLLALLQLYERFLAANLPSYQIRPHYLQEYLKWLHIAKTTMPDDLGVNVGLFNVCLELELWDDTLAMASRLEQILPKQAFSWVMAMKVHYGRRNYQKVAEYAAKIKEACQDVPSEYSGIVSYWS